MKFYRVLALLALSSLLALVPGCSGDDPTEPTDPGSGLSCTDYRDYLHVSATTVFPDFYWSGDLVVVGDVAYIANETAGLVIADVSDPENVRVIGQVEIIGDPVAVAVAGGYAYVASSRLTVVDVSDPATPTVVDSSLFGGVDVALVESTAYVASGYTGGVRVVDVSDPTAPVAGEIVSTGGSTRVVAAGERIYVANRSRVHVLDIEDRDDPEPVDVIDFGDVYLQDVAVQDNLLFAVSDSVLHVVDLATGAVIVDGQNIGGGARFQKIILRGSEAYFLSDTLYSGGVYIYDIGDPGAPVRIGRMPSWESFGFDVAGDRIFVADGRSGINTIVPGPSAREAIPESAVLSGGFHRVVVNRSLAACWAEYAPRFSLVDVSDPGAPLMASVFEMKYVHDIALADDFAYVAEGPYGLQIVDVSDPGSPELRGNVRPPDFPTVVAVASDMALVIGENRGLHFIDVADPDAPTLVGEVELPGNGYDVAIMGDLALVTTSFGGGLQVVDWSDPTTPVIVGSMETPGRATMVTAADGLVYIADESAFLVVDVSTPSDPVIVGSLPAINGDAYRVVVDGHRAYVFSPVSGLTVVDVSNPTHPSLLAAPGMFVDGGWDFAFSPRGFGIVAGDEFATVPLQCGNGRGGPQWW